ncbi:hypothetical protein VPH35_009986 [Triticum aestivum]
MSSLSWSADLPWQARGGGVFDVGQGSALVLASYPVLLFLVLVSAFVRYVWIALALYCAILFVLFCTGRLLAGPVVFVHDEAMAAVERGGLPQASIAAIPAFVYGTTASAGAGWGEFHIGCIDMWFHSHATCPVCRCHVEPQKAGKMSPLAPEPALPPV